MAWLLKSEYEYYLHSLSEKLDIAKHKHFLHFSLDVNRCIRSESPFMHYLNNGKKHLAENVKNNIRSVCQLRTHKLYCAMCACCVDDVNLSHVFNLLRIEEILEGLQSDLSVSLSASILIAMIGEMHAVRKDLLNCAGNSHFKEYRTKNSLFLKNVLKDLISLIIESGRDRATYLKESLVMPSITPPRMNNGFAISNLEEEKKIEEDMYDYSKKLLREIEGCAYKDKYLLSIYSIYERGDSRLERLLQAGSLSSIWVRLHQISDLNTQNATQLIQWSIIRQLPRLNRCRQLIFTRLLQSLCLPQWNDFHKEKTQYYVRNSSNINIAKIVCENFISSGIRLWCYEHESQKLDILKSSLISNTVAREVVTLLNVKVDRGLVDISMTNELPDMESLAQLFSECMPYGKMYEKMNITDMNLYRKLPELYHNDFSGVKTSKLLGSRFHGAAPEFGVSDDIRFFTNPLITALLDKEKFSQTVDEFLQTTKDSDFIDNDRLEIV